MWYLETKHCYNLKKLRVSGESFESFVVRYYSETVEHLGLENATNGELAAAYSLLLGKQPLISYHKVAPIFEALLEEELNKIPSASSMEAFDHMFLYFRGSTHAGNMDRVYYSSAWCNPLQAPSLLEAKKMWINNFTENKIIWDLLYALNPILCCMPFNSKKNNESRHKAADIMLADDSMKHCRLTLDSNRELYDKAMQERRAATTVDIEDAYRWNREKMGGIPEIVMDNCLLGIQRLSRYRDGRWKYDLCMQIYYYLTVEQADEDEVRILHNKIYSVLDSMDALGLQ